MGFADQYLQKHAIREALITEPCDPNVQLIVTIPAYRESRLIVSLDSLYSNIIFTYCEVIVLVNSPIEADSETVQLNSICFNEATKWVANHPHEFIKFHILHEKELPRKHFGAGLARKLVMDEATRRLSSIDRQDGIILSLDADTVVESNYLQEIEHHFKKHPQSDGCSINFEHPINNTQLNRKSSYSNKKPLHPKDEDLNKSEDLNKAEIPEEFFSDEVYEAIINYELYQRYFLESLRFAECRYAYHTVGSAFAVRPQSYAKQGGMSKRQAGEDFYFIQKLAVLGNYTECNATTVRPSPRPSNRVPFGTGPEIQRQLDNPGMGIKVHSINTFSEIQKFFSSLWEVYRVGLPQFREKLSHSLNLYLNSTDFDNSIEEILNNSNSFLSFLKRCRRKFNQFWILKYLHFAEENGHPKIDLMEAINEYFKFIEEDVHFDKPTSALTYFRDLNKISPDFQSIDARYELFASGKGLTDSQQ